ncbi:hypothetical protein PIB30_052625 [Stylosanthes scabra]|uniref:Uncharacterized protein n=1 Tax=Stylosanthes scabra TaxID=79078 RepID=A0ABU6UJ35_9FABA|nr:hypothetical protein [Stylosanthes scabra]
MPQTGSARKHFTGHDAGGDDDSASGHTFCPSLAASEGNWRNGDEDLTSAKISVTWQRSKRTVIIATKERIFVAIVSGERRKMKGELAGEARLGLTNEGVFLFLELGLSCCNFAGIRRERER